MMIDSEIGNFYLVNRSMNFNSTCKILVRIHTKLCCNFKLYNHETNTDVYDSLNIVFNRLFNLNWNKNTNISIVMDRKSFKYADNIDKLFKNSFCSSVRGKIRGEGVYVHETVRICRRIKLWKPLTRDRKTPLDN